jgi:hypothetical protein
MAEVEIIDDVKINDIDDGNEEKEIEEVPDISKEASFGINDDGDIPDEDIKGMLFLFCVNEDIPLHYKQLLGKVIKKDTYKKNEKLFIFNMIGYIWKHTEEKNELTKTQKVIIVRRIHKLLFGKFDE